MNATTFKLASDFFTSAASSIEGYNTLRSLDRVPARTEDERSANRLRGAKKLKNLQHEASARLRAPIQIVPVYKTWRKIVEGFIDEIFTCNDLGSLNFNLGRFDPTEAVLCRRCMRPSPFCRLFELGTPDEAGLYVICEGCLPSTNGFRAVFVQRRRIPPRPDRQEPCSVCKEETDEVYLYCQECKGGKFVLCLNCAFSGQGCRDSTFRRRHQLGIVTRYICYEYKPQDQPLSMRVVEDEGHNSRDRGCNDRDRHRVKYIRVKRHN